MPFRVLAAAVLAGLLLGVISGLLRGGGAAYDYDDVWTEFPSAHDGDIASAVARLVGSAIWRSEEVAADATEAAQGVSGKTGVLAYLTLVAVIKDPVAAALLRLAGAGDNLRDQLLLEPDSNGLVTARLGDEITGGWRVSAISETTMTLAADPGQASAGEESIHYGLFE
jgi:hypothetical protein